jgi:phage shock protein E
MTTMTKLIILLAAIVAVVAVVLLMRRGGDVPAGQARQLVAQGALLVDVRTPEEFAAAHLPGALNLPVADLERRLHELPRDRPLVLYCRSGNRSAKAAARLRSEGFTAVHDLGAMSSW